MQQPKLEGTAYSTLAIVGEAWGAAEEAAKQPFVGPSGALLNSWLKIAGTERSKCLVTNVCNWRPPQNDLSKFFYTKTQAKKLGREPYLGRYPHDEVIAGVEELRRRLNDVRPGAILALGDTALWALTGLTGITHWRGSLLHYQPNGQALCSLVPTYHPAAVLRQPQWEAIALHDVIRVVETVESGTLWVGPNENIIIDPDYQEACSVLSRLIERRECVAADIETNHKEGLITCIGLAWLEEEPGKGEVFALSLPTTPGHWTDPEWEVLHDLLRTLLTAPRSLVVWQNAAYDVTWIERCWSFRPRVDEDTMVMQHSAWPGLPKALDFLASLYLAWYKQWKAPISEMSNEELWTYNAKDAIATRMLLPELHEQLRDTNTVDVYRECMALYDVVLSIMRKGIRIDVQRLQALDSTLSYRQEELLSLIQEYVAPHIENFNPNSTPQMRELFYDKLQLKQRRNRKSGKPTLSDQALASLARQYPSLRQLIENIREFRSLKVFRSTFTNMDKLSTDGRVRCTLTIGGTETGRFSSSSSPFGEGTNLENIPKDKRVRDCFLPEEGHLLVECDLDRADAQVVAWEADDDDLKRRFKENADIHMENAQDIGCSRDLAKRGVHATNYACSVGTLAASLEITREEAEAFQTKWFAAHPKIKQWQIRTYKALQSEGKVKTPFGRVRQYFGRLDDRTLSEALAYVPQSVVADVTNRGMARIHSELPDVVVLMQIHDSVLMSVPKAQALDLLPAIRECMSVPIPYEDPLVIPVSFKMGERWGSMEEVLPSLSPEVAL